MDRRPGRGSEGAFVPGGMITRRRLMQYGAGAGAGLVMWRFAGGRVWAHPLGTGDARRHGDPEVRDVPGDPAGDAAQRQSHGKKGRGVDYYRIGVRQFEQEILPGTMDLGPTKVWSYGSVDHPETFSYPAFTIEAAWGKPVRVKWINDLMKSDGRFRPHLLPIDQTLHWANPPGGIHGRDDHGTDHGPYRGPVPIVTHLHGGHSDQQSDGYPEAWYLPKAATFRTATPRWARSTRSSGRLPRPSSARRGLPGAPSSSTTTTSARRRCGTTTTPWG